jgi:hypothetical protein
MVSERQPIKPAQSSGASAASSPVSPVARVGHELRGKSAVARISGKHRVVAEIFAGFQAIGTSATRRAQPWDAHALAKVQRRHARSKCVNPSDHLVTGHDRIGNIGQFTVDNVEIGAAHAAGADLDADHAGTRRRIWPLAQNQRFAWRLQYHGLHRNVLC